MPPPLPRTCFRCGARYYRRNALEAWVTLPNGARTKDVIRICLHCMSNAETARLVMRVANLSGSIAAVQRKLNGARAAES